MPIPLTQPCPQCEADMELLTTADDGDIVVYECPDCGCQVENEVKDDVAEDDQVSNELSSDDDQTSNELPSDDES